MSKKIKNRYVDEYDDDEYGNFRRPNRKSQRKQEKEVLRDFTNNSLKDNEIDYDEYMDYLEHGDN